MSTRRSRQLGNKYIRPEDIQNFIYDSDEENPRKGLIGEGDETLDSRKKAVLKAEFVRGSGVEDENESLRVVGVHEVDNRERERQKLEEWYGGSKYLSRNKLNNSVTREEHNQGRRSVFNHSVLGNRNSELEIIHTGKKAIEDNSEEKEESSEGESSLFQNIKRRTSSGDSSEVSDPKRFKVEVDKEMTDTPAPTLKPLEIELALENSLRNEPIRRRNINTIVEELDQIGRNWKENYSRCLPSFRWGQTIIKNCSEKWNSHYFPPKMLEINLKGSQDRYLSGSRIVDCSEESGFDGYNSQSDIVEASNINIESEGVDEEGSEALQYEQGTSFSGGSNSMRDDLNSFNSDIHESMTLRSENQGISNEAGTSEKSAKENPLKKSSQRGNKDHKKQIHSNRQLASQMEGREGAHRQYQNDESSDSNKNCEGIKGNYENYGGSSQMNSIKLNYPENSVQALTMMNEDEEDQITCPICERNFKKNQIVAHASQCATATYND